MKRVKINSPKTNTESKSRGLYTKYITVKADGTPVNERCFVLKPESDPVAIGALRTYAATTDNEQLRDDLYAWVGKPKSKPLTPEELQAIKDTGKDHVWPYNTPPYLWLEKKETNDIWDCWACWRDVHDAITHGLHGCYPEDYGKTWRCWKIKPTDEERMNYPWEND